MGQHRLRMALEIGAEPCHQPIIWRRVIEIVGLAGEAEARRIEHRQFRELRPRVAGMLKIGNVRCMRELIEAMVHIPVNGAECCDDKQQQDQGAVAPTGRRADCIFLVVRERNNMSRCRHPASVNITR